MPAADRSALIDCTKGLACAAIVWHHLAFYGPLADAARPAMPALIDWLAEYARMAVQVFLVLSGYLTAANLAPQGHARFGDPWARVARRFVRLVVPYAVALLVAIVVAAAVRPWFDHESVSGEPSLWQLVAHALLLQNIVGEESLSAGVWYVAIDFQLFALAVLLLWGVQMLAAAVRARWGAQAVARWWPWSVTGAQALVVAGVAASLYGFNLDVQWDVWAVYFFGAYGLGMLAYWAVQSPRALGAWGWALLMAALVLGALALQWRTRIAVAGGLALAFVAAMRWPAMAAWAGWAQLRRLGRISYSVFLVHFSACLLVNAVVSSLWPGAVAPAVLGMVVAFLLSIAAGHLLYERVERHVPTWRTALRWQAGFVGAGLAVALAAGLR